VTAGDLDHVGIQESIVIGDRPHWSRFESGVASELIVLVMPAGPYCHEQVTKSGRPGVRSKPAAGARPLRTIMTAAAQPYCGKSGENASGE
jgi:hypothetical protein